MLPGDPFQAFGRERPFLPTGARSFRHVLVAALCFLPLGAHAQDFGGIDQNALPAPGGMGQFFTFQPAIPMQPGVSNAALRFSYLKRPLGSTQPSPSPSGTQSTPVDNSLITELGLSLGLGAGLDLNVSLPYVLYQTGDGLAPLGIGGELSSTEPGDPSVTFGWGTAIGALQLRPYASVILPLGSSEDFTGERNTRGRAGVALGLSSGPWTFGAQLGALFRERSSLGLTTWASQAHLAVGGSVQIIQCVEVTTELNLMPVLAGQPTPTSGSAGVLFPAEVVAGFRLTHDNLRLGLFGGTGIPFSVPSSESPGASARRGPTSPVLRMGLQAQLAF